MTSKEAPGALWPRRTIPTPLLIGSGSKGRPCRGPLSRRRLPSCARNHRERARAAQAGRPPWSRAPRALGWAGQHRRESAHGAGQGRAPPPDRPGARRAAADLVIKGARILNVATGTLDAGDVAICGDWIVGTHDDYRGETRDRRARADRGAGFIDTHVHVESSLVVPAEFERASCRAAPRPRSATRTRSRMCLAWTGSATSSRLAETLRMTLRVQLSSCVPATELETSGARLEAADLVAVRDHPRCSASPR